MHAIIMYPPRKLALTSSSLETQTSLGDILAAGSRGEDLRSTTGCDLILLGVANSSKDAFDIFADRRWRAVSSVDGVFDLEPIGV